MPRRLPTLEDIKALIPSELHRRTVVAGGFAHDPEKAHDVDIWVLRQGETPEGAIYPPMQEDAERITAHLADPTTPWVEAEEPIYTELDDQKILLVKAGRFDHHDTATFGMPFHILCAGTNDLTTLLGWFDLYIHAVGYPLLYPDFILRPYLLSNPAAPAPLHVRHAAVADPLSTLMRLVRFSKRYERTIDFRAARVLLERAASEAATAAVLDAEPEPEDDEALIASDIPF